MEGTFGAHATKSSPTRALISAATVSARTSSTIGAILGSAGAVPQRAFEHDAGPWLAREGELILAKDANGRVAAVAQRDDHGVPGVTVRTRSRLLPL